MNGLRWRQSSALVGIAIEETRIRFLQASQSHGAVGAVCCGAAEIEPLGAGHPGHWSVRMGGRLHAAMQSAGITATNAVAALPLRQLAFESMTVARMPAESMAEAVRCRAASALGQRTSEICTAFHPVSGGAGASGDVRVLAVSVVNGDAERAAGVLRNAGLNVRAIDAWPYAVARCVQPRDPMSGLASPCLLVGLCGSTRITCLVHGHEVRFVRCVLGRAEELQESPGGGDDSDEPGLSAPEVVAHEVALMAHHLAETLPERERPVIGCVIGAGPREAHYIKALSAATATSFVPCADVVPAPWRNALRTRVALSEIDCWLPSLGLWLYDEESAGVAA